MKPKPLFATAHVVQVISPRAGVAHGIDEWHEPHGTLQSVVWSDPAQPGIFLHCRLGASGLQLLRPDEKGVIAVCIPLDTLFALAHEINPQFKALLNKNLPDAEVQKLADSIPASTV